jgi:hypothetical protein
MENETSIDWGDRLPCRRALCINGGGVQLKSELNWQRD